ncbi:hypothetical protein NDU88_003604 [Pleurodeles waltl]|uniref:Uncharacterized protein n=1 Tax=Pleurodeles waltl TaxID=8319 RepID=A0AAV7W2N2_PLEWA|nr:hypothetical protein NDU88_003604 [Pleurodeles waltl]
MGVGTRRDTRGAEDPATATTHHIAAITRTETPWVVDNLSFVPGSSGANPRPRWDEPPWARVDLPVFHFQQSAVKRSLLKDLRQQESAGERCLRLHCVRGLAPAQCGIQPSKAAELVENGPWEPRR